MTGAAQSVSGTSGAGSRLASEPVLHGLGLGLWRVQSGALMVLGRGRGPVPSTGALQVSRAPSPGGDDARASRGVFRAVSWPLARADDAGAVAFLLAVRFSDAADPAEGAVLAFLGPAGERLMLRLPPAQTEGAFGQQAARLAGQHAPAAASFLLEVLRARAAGEAVEAATAAGRVLRAFLTQAAQPDGTIEIMAAVPGVCVLLQGWGARLFGPVQVVLAGATLPCFTGHAGDFARTDIAAPATGTVLTLPPGAARILAGTDHVFLLSEQGLHSRSLVEHRLLDPTSSIGHIRHMRPSLRCPPPMDEALTEALRPRYEGRDTLCHDTHAVRGAIDIAVSATAGVYLSGWVFDPVQLTAEIHLCGTAGLRARIDADWVRLRRQDVIDGFRETAGFPRGSNAEAGFAVSLADAPAANETLFLQFTFNDGNRAFLPVHAANLDDPAVRARVLASVDLSLPTGATVLEQCVAPLLARLRPAAPTAARMLLQGMTSRLHAIVVPLAEPLLPRAFLSGLLQDGLDADEQLVLVCGPEWDQASVAGLRNAVRFYALPATVLVSAETAGPATALREAARETSASLFLLAMPGIAGSAPGWRQGLFSAISGPAGAAFACPTLVYEDWSVRYAGSTELAFQDLVPALQQSHVAGMPAGKARDQAPVPAAMGTLQCCAMQRRTVAALDSTRVFMSDAGREVDAFLRLRGAGVRGTWLPALQVFAPDGSAGPEQDRYNQAARIVDGRMLRDTWAALSKVTGV